MQVKVQVVDLSDLTDPEGVSSPVRTGRYRSKSQLSSRIPLALKGSHLRKNRPMQVKVQVVDLSDLTDPEGVSSPVRTGRYRSKSQLSSRIPLALKGSHLR
ncbi:hypothetical protein CDAR_22551 [Caerostris darwini]|uniref:Neurotrophin-3 n=1 Tax=Caerostris darwini TaxID=1538125 RepID=A0AAV4V8M4_9ARAC|nr:hypothetical protein CDAR_22551 [Caerostris darwini]